MPYITLGDFFQFAAALGGWVAFWIQHRHGMKDRLQNSILQSQLDEQNHRAQSTNFEPISSARIDNFRVSEFLEVDRNHPGVLCPPKDRVSFGIAEDESVYLPVVNRGGSFLEIGFLSENPSICIEFIDSRNSAADLSGILSYRYRSAMDGRTVRIYVCYTTPQGIIRKDTYEHIIGRRTLRRIEPQLVEDLMKAKQN